MSEERFAPRTTAASPLLRRLPADATPLDLARAYADLAIVVMQGQQQRTAKLEAIADKMQAIIVVGDSRLVEIRQAQRDLDEQIGKVTFEQGRLDGAMRELTDFKKKVQQQVADLEDSVEEVTTGQHKLEPDQVRKVIASVTNETELETRRAADAKRREMRDKVIAGVLTALGSAGALELARIVITHHP